MERYFTKEEVNKIIEYERVCNYRKEYLDIKVKDFFDYFIEKNIEKNSIKRIILTYPRILTMSLDSIKEKYDSIEKIFDKNTNKIIVLNSRILSHSNDFIENRMNYFKELGFKDNNIIKIFLKFYNNITISTKNIDINMRYLESKITDKTKLIAIIKKTPSLLSFSIETLKEKFNWFYQKGYTEEQTIKIICKAKTILTREFVQNNNSDSNVEKKYKYLHEELKYTKEQIINITYLYPEYYTQSLDTIKERIKNLLRLGFDDNAVKTLFYKFPQIISFKESTMKKKYNYYLNLDMLEIFAKSPKYLMQSLDVTEARYTYLINKGLQINKYNYKKLFISDKKFKLTYGIDNESLLKLYSEKEGYYEQRTNKSNTNKHRARIIKSE